MLSATPSNATTPRPTLVGATTIGPQDSGPIPLQPPSRSPIDAQGRLVGSYDPLARARAILAQTAIARSADQLTQPWQGGQLGSAGIDPTQLAPGAYARAVRTGISQIPPSSPTYWRPDAITATAVPQQMWIRQVNPVFAARHTIDPFIASVRSTAPGLANWPGAWPVYRQYTPATAIDPSYPGQGTSPTSTPCATCTYSPSVAVEQRGTVPAAAPAAARSAFGFWRP